MTKLRMLIILLIKQEEKKQIKITCNNYDLNNQTWQECIARTIKCIDIQNRFKREIMRDCTKQRWIKTLDVRRSDGLNT